MAHDLDPSLAEKVLAADLRNLVKKVGDGGTLSSADRQIFFDIAEGAATPEQVKEARIGALMRKWMDGCRLSHSERDEIAHLLPDAVAVSTEAPPLTQQPGQLSEEEVMRIYEISRAKYYRWQKEGQAVSEGPDPPPFEEPRAMVAWYERMRGRGIFKMQCPQILKTLAAKGFPSASPPTATSSPVQPKREPPPVPSGLGTSVPEEERGFLFELERQEIKTARERRAADDAFEKGDFQNYALLNAEHSSSLDLLRKMQTQKEAVALSEKTMVKTSTLVELQSTIVRSIILQLRSPQQLKPMYEQLALSSAGVTFEAFIALMAKHVRDCFAELVTHRLAEPYALEAA